MPHSLRLSPRPTSTAPCGHSDARLDASGNGTHEIRNWVAVAGAMHPARPRVVTGIPFVPGLGQRRASAAVGQRMSAATLTQFLIDVTRGHRKDAFAADPEGVLAASSLDEPLRAAVLAQDIGALWLAGAHPMALMYFARASGWTNERYYRCVVGSGAHESRFSRGCSAG